ncbi:MAG: NUDIX hydrolase [Chloroflexota bacterium]
MALRERFASFIRRFPKVMLLPYYAYRFFQPKYSVGVVGVVLNARDEVLLVEHVFHPRVPWGLPGGWIGANEDPAETVVRELKEELNLTVYVERLVLMGRTQYHHLDIAYLCRTDDSVGALSYELLGHRWVKEQDLPRMNPFHRQAIHHALYDGQDKPQ